MYTINYTPRGWLMSMAEVFHSFVQKILQKKKNHSIYYYEQSNSNR
jgi:hypothetical protein